MTNFLDLNVDAFSHSQIVSKLWLCESLESLALPNNPRIWLLAGWYALSAFLLMSRGKINPSIIRSFDIDPIANDNADRMMATWLIDDWKFKAYTCNINNLDYYNPEFRGEPHIVINSSVEHIIGRAWFDNIPTGTLVVLQSNNMPHEDHIRTDNTWQDLNEDFPCSELLFAGEKEFNYPDLTFKRIMIIGRR